MRVRMRAGGVFRRLIFWMKAGTLQYAILKTAMSILSIILWTNGNFDPSDVSPSVSAPSHRQHAQGELVGPHLTTRGMISIAAW